MHAEEPASGFGVEEFTPLARLVGVSYGIVVAY